MSGQLRQLIALLATWTNVRHNLQNGFAMPPDIQREMIDSTLDILGVVIAAMAINEGISDEDTAGEITAAMRSISEAEEEHMH